MLDGTPVQNVSSPDNIFSEQDTDRKKHTGPLSGSSQLVPLVD